MTGAPSAIDGTMQKAAARHQTLNWQFLEDGEEVRAAVVGNAGNGLLTHYLLFGMALRMARVSKDLIFVVTDRNVYVLRGRFWRINRGKELLQKHARGQVSVSSRGLVVKVGKHSLVQWDYTKAGRLGSQFTALASQPGI